MLSSAIEAPAAQQHFWSRIAEALFAEQQLKSVAVLCQGGITHLPHSSFAGVSSEPGCPLSCVSGAHRGSCTISLLTCAPAE